jgi:glycosidase
MSCPGLDYLVDLGITSLWITPLFLHNGEYHGYCTTDPTQLDPGFGTSDELLALVRSAHSRGIFVVLDIVVNHLCDRGTNYSKFVSHSDCCNGLNSNYWAGYPGTSGPQGDINFSNSFFAPFRNPHFFNRCGPNTAHETSGEGPPSLFGDFVAGMFDYDTRNYDWQQLYTELLKPW